MEHTEKSARALAEEKVLEFWKENNIFKKTLEKDSPMGEFVFFEGPPTANAKPALHHLEARAFKDVIPRYKTMRGFSVPRRAGWDTHGLPVELQIEKKLGLASKKEIEQYGIASFNKECKESVFTYIKDWETFTDRIGYWVDKESAYYTFNNSYIESLWNIVSTVEQKGLLYKDYKIIPWCARCGTGLSSHELAQEYHDVKDLSVYAKFKVVGEENTFIVAWTTTPWTLPGNAALAVGADIEYVKVQTNNEVLIVAKERLALLEGEQEILAEVKGSDLVGLAYEPLYPYLSELLDESQKEKLVNAYKVYAAGFVTTTDGTGVVHIAPMYGADDFELGTKVGLLKFHLVSTSGLFIDGTDFFAGRFAKDEAVAIDVIKDLAARGQLFKKEKYEHSYPHCWRCKTPLIYYARDSWYIGMSTLSAELVAQNEHINWEPGHIKEGRFGEWLRGIKDWAISRERYWGTPLPIWVSEDGDRLVIGSLDELKSLMKTSGNTYTLMRHVETENNLKGVWSYRDEKNDVLTENGKKKLIEGAELLQASGIDMIVTSPFSRTLETAQCVAETLGLDASAVISDDRLKEWNVGSEYDGKTYDEYFAVRNIAGDRYEFKAVDGESYKEVFVRAAACLYELEEKYKGKNILIVSHGAVLRAMELLSQGVTFKELFERSRDYVNFNNAEIRTIAFTPLPHNENFELDVHRPYIDDVILEKEGKEYTRIKEVMDVWFDSGAMPFAQNHYPFENKEYVDTLAHRADFISEAIDQTRGWFYTLHAIGTLMGKGYAYKNVICLGHLLDAEGKKMSKSIGNIVDPWEQMAKYGVDTIRLWMYSVNQPGDSKNYDERTVVELQRQVFGLYLNTLSFYELYRDVGVENEYVPQGNHVLDMWIMARLHEFTSLTTEHLEAYKTFEPVRALRVFMDDLSTWYVRRCRDRLREGDSDAKYTLYTVLKTIAKLIAPFAPFASEEVWQKLRNENDEESVHLAAWPDVGAVDMYVIDSMEQVRSICTVGNGLRKKIGIPLRQPLAALLLRVLTLDEEYVEIIAEELNVKTVVTDSAIEEEIMLDTHISEDLQEEGVMRELCRIVQDMRKGQGLVPDDRIKLVITTNPKGQSIIKRFENEIGETVGAESITTAESDTGEIEIAGTPFTISI